jgi:uncharacterized membrane protein YsdA (DUF1294 family)
MPVSKMNQTILSYLLLVNLLAFGIWGLDKKLARLVAVTGGRRDQGGHSRIMRIPEKWLLILAAAGGCWGSWAGALLFRHKLRKPGLLWPLAGITVLHAALLGILQ